LNLNVHVLRISILTRFFKASPLAALIMCGALSITSAQVLAATVKVSDNLIVNEVNDKVIDHKFIGHKRTFELNPGNHALIVRYKDVFEDLDMGDESLVESQPFVVKFTVADQDKLALNTIKIDNLAEAEKFSQSPELMLKDERNNEVDLTLELVEQYKLAKQVDLVVNSLAVSKVIEAKTSGSVHPASVATKTSKHTPTEVKASSMLKYWWHNASSDEQQRFKHYIQANK